MAGREPPDYGTIATAQRVGISLRQLYYWVHVLRVVRPQIRQHGKRRFRHFTPADVRALQLVKRRLDQGYTLQAAAKAAKRF